MAMPGNEAEEALNRIRASLQILLTSDALVSALAAAAENYRRATVCLPFPPCLEAGPGRDFSALRECVQSLPPLTALSDPAQAVRLSSKQILILDWLLHHPRRPATSLRPVTLPQLQDRLPTASFLAEMAANASLLPDYAIELLPPEASSKARGRSEVIAFHGTSFENIHSILHLGLLNMSGTRLERTGAAFGDGIYLSTSLNVAFEFCQASSAWRNSLIGSRLRCVLVCGVEREHAQPSQQAGGLTGPPERYLIVERSDVVTLRYLLVYVDKAAPAALEAGRGAPAHAGAHAAGQPALRSVPLLVMLISAYALWLVYIGAINHWPLMRRLLRRHFGLYL